MNEPSNSDDDGNNNCAICDKIGSSSQSNSDLGAIIKVTRGISTLKAVSAERADGLIQYLNTREFVYVHTVCRQKYINKKYIQAYLNKKNTTSSCSPPKKKFRTATSVDFDWKNRCFFCEKEADEKKEKKKNKAMRQKISHVTNFSLKNTILDLISNDESQYCRNINERIVSVLDLVAQGAKYHMDCYTSLKNTIRKTQREKKIHPITARVDAAMEQIIKYIEENNDCQFSLTELKNILTTDHIPDDKTIKMRLMKYYGDNIVVSSKFGSNTIVCFKNKHYEILYDEWNKQRSNDEEEEFRILKAAGEILQRHIRTQVDDNNIYPASDKMLVNVPESIPKSLNFFLSEMILNAKRDKPECISYYETKCTSIAHEIISAVRP
ncbi:hypothetical protein PV327_008115 [Microctonus hyperodae]|uniref:Uncharacterized protein n=1 Tax=Microctonus hyperodae TaxID=165561 RepID=A0AA39KGS0_MICHY|nr:hypothetical protein PV327_008115 [Microctonus hyperodae]